MIDIDIKNQLISRTAKVIMFVDKNPKINIKEISRALNIDYNFVSKIIVRCEERNFISSEMVSREKRVKLNKKGEELSEAIQVIEKLVE